MQRPAATTSDAGKWSHDLFGQNSDLYSPSINLSNLRKRVPGWDQPTTSASLRPYGDATPAAQPLIVSATGQVIGYASAGAQSGASSASGAIGIKGTNAVAQARREAELLRKQQERERAEVLRKRKELEAEWQRKVKIAEEEDLGFVVEVAGLVTGTSAEDVQVRSPFAFGSESMIFDRARAFYRPHSDSMARSASVSLSINPRATSSHVSPSPATTMLLLHAPSSSACLFRVPPEYGLRADSLPRVLQWRHCRRKAITGTIGQAHTDAGSLTADARTCRLAGARSDPSRSCTCAPKQDVCRPD